MISQIIKKEIRLILPEWIAAMALAASPVMVVMFAKALDLPEPRGLVGFATLFQFPGMLLVTCACLGKENVSDTLELLLMQPLTRRQIWIGKFLLACLTLLSTLLLAMTAGWLANAIGAPNSYIKPNTGYSRGQFLFIFALLGSALLYPCYFRRLHEVVWTSILVPITIVLGCLHLASKLEFNNEGLLGESALFVYGLAALALSFRTLCRWESNVGLSKALNFSLDRSSHRKKQKLPVSRTIPALVGKELRLQQASFLITGVLFVAYGILIYLIYRGQNEGWNNGSKDIIEGMLVMLHFTWLLVPVGIGAAAFAEERSLGVDQWQMTLPISRKRQWRVKLGIAISLGLLLGSIAPATLQLLSNKVVTNQFWRGSEPAAMSRIIMLTTWALPLPFTLLGLYGGSLSRSTLQAMLASGLALGFIGLQCSLAYYFVTPYATVPPHTFVSLVMAVLIPYRLADLTYRNFTQWESLRRPWLTNALVWLALTVATTTICTAGFSRFWENWRSVPELVNRPASITTTPAIISDSPGNLILSPSGKLWELTKERTETGAALPSSLKAIGPEETWLKILSTSPHRLGINTDGSLLAWRREWDQTSRGIGKKATAPHEPIPGVGWRDLSLQAADRGPHTVFALDDQGRLYSALADKTLTFRREPQTERLNKIAASPGFLLAITENGQLTLIGPDAWGFFTPPHTQSAMSSKKEDHQIFDQGEEWTHIHLLPYTLRLPEGGLSDPARANQILNRQTPIGAFPAKLYPSAIFEKSDGSHWTLGWMAQILYDQPALSHQAFELVELARTPILNPGFQKLAVNRAALAYGIDPNGFLHRSPVSSLQFTQARGLGITHSETTILGTRNDWLTSFAYPIASDRFFAITANDILWTWGRPIDEYYSRSLQEQWAARRILPYPRTPTPLFDLRTGERIQE